ncbi:MAG: hypothetical protein IPM57_08780 [Oligoflexia bacterium]|nr:hypothetical protein [Oligoflexia bacterium]
MSEVRTYMAFSSIIDPAKIVTTPDMDLSYALASTMVEWGIDKQFVSGLAEKWEIIGDRIFRFHIRKNTKWSNGKPVTSSQVKKSLERGIKVHPTDMQSFTKIVEKMELPSKDTIDFRLKVDAVTSGLLGKLTEPNFGIVYVNDDGSLDLSTTTGAFYLKKNSKTELYLERNENWINFNSNSAKSINIRQPEKGILNQALLLEDNWPNLIQTSSLIPADIMKKYEDKSFQIWRRPTDRIFIFQLSKSLHNSDGLNLFKYLYRKINREKVVQGLAGFQLTEQMFPKGYQLHAPDFKVDLGAVTLPTVYKTRPLKILISPERVPQTLKENLEKVIKEAVGLAPTFISVPINEVHNYYKKGEYDFYAGTVGLADPDPEGAMSFYFENEFRIIPSIESDFIKRLDAARKQQNKMEKLKQMRSMLADAVNTGHLLPLFNSSTIGIARKGIDLSHVPLTDESVTLSKIRFTQEANQK